MDVCGKRGGKRQEKWEKRRDGKKYKDSGKRDGCLQETRWEKWEGNEVEKETGKRETPGEKILGDGKQWRR